VRNARGDESDFTGREHKAARRGGQCVFGGVIEVDQNSAYGSSPLSSCFSSFRFNHILLLQPNTQRGQKKTEQHMSAIPGYKDIIQLIKTGATIEAQEKIMELRESALELQNDNLSLRARVIELEQQIGSSTAMEFKKPFYFRAGDEHPFCPVCWEKDKTSLHLSGLSGSAEWFTCPVCKWTHAQKPELQSRVATVPRRNNWSVMI
jgi:hypothetical protein